MGTLTLVLLGLAFAALLIGCAWLALRPGTTSGGSAPTGPAPRAPTPDGPLAGVLPGDLHAPAGRLVLLQLSSAFSGTCRDARSVLDDVAAEVPGVVHRDVDLAARPELVRLLDVVDTPTTLLVDAAGVELLRITGVPRRAALTAALEPHLTSGGHGRFR